MATLFSIIGLLGIPVGLYFTALTLRGVNTVWGWLWLVTFISLDLAALWASTYPRRSRVALGVAAAALALIVGVRSTRMHATAQGTLLSLPSEGGGRWLARLYDEGDAALVGFTALSDFGVVRKEEASEARPLIRAAYRRLRQDPDFDRVPAPFLPTLLGRQSPSGTDTLVFNTGATAESGRAPRAIVFLHGLGGNFKLPCWLLARRMPDALVVCPSIGLSGDWSLPGGQATFEAARRYAQQRSSAVYVIGLSGGAVGVQHLIGQNALGHLAGAVMISGLSENDDDFDAIRRSDVPLLIIRGAQDTRVHAPRLEGLAAHRVRYLEVPGGHYAFLANEDAVLEALDEFAAPH